MKLGSAAAASALIGTAGSDRATASPPSDWGLTFEDDFSSGSLDESIWNIGFGWGMEHGSAEEVIVEENVEVSDGMLRLWLTDGGSDPHAGAVNTQDNLTIEPPVYVEADIRAPDADGTVTAFWSKPNNEDWPPEIDFMEVPNHGSTPDTTHHTAHWSDTPGDSSTHDEEGATYDVGDTSAAFHTYGTEWREDRVTWYVDGEEVWSLTDSYAVDRLAAQLPYYIMFNPHCALASWVDYPSMDGWPKSMDVDRFAVYTPDGDGGSGDPEGKEYFWIRSGTEGEPVEYEFTSSEGGIELVENGENAWVTDDGYRAGGVVDTSGSTGDGFWFAGEIDGFDYSGPAELWVDDVQTDPDSLPELENAQPTCSLVNPTDGDAIDDPVTIQVDAGDYEDDDSTLDVEVSIDGGAWQRASYDGDSGYYTLEWDGNAADQGDHTLQARATDADGATTESAQITVTVEKRYFWIRSATDGEPVEYEFTSSEGGIELVENGENAWVQDDGFRAGGVVDTSGSTGDGFWFAGEIDGFAYSGPAEIWIHDVQTDPDSLPDLEDNTQPSCAIVQPTGGETVGDTVTIQVDAGDYEDDDSTLDVEVSIDGGAWQSASYDGDSGYYTLEWDTSNADDGEHSIQARATDADGATTESAQIAVTVDNSSDSEPASFAVAITDAAQTPVREGETVLVSATVENTGGSAATQTVELAIDGGQVDAQDVSLEAGQSATVEFAWHTQEGISGDHTATVASADDSESATAAVCQSGDIDYSGNVDSLDATLTQREVAGIGEEGAYANCADMDGDGEVRSLDVTKILQKIVE